MSNNKKVEKQIARNVSTSEKLKITIGCQNSEFSKELSFKFKNQPRSCKNSSGNIFSLMADKNDFFA